MPLLVAKGEVVADSANQNEAAEERTANSPVDPSRYCPICSQRLESFRCKLICNVCGYYMSCADYY
jgi:hypothetical protein